MKKIFICLGLLMSLNVYANEKILEENKYKNILKKAEQLYSKKDLSDALDRMAHEITQELQDKNPIFVCVLNGALVPMGQLMTRLDFPLQVDYIHATRYGGKVEGGELKILAKPKLSFKDRNIILVEDVIDSGRTLQSVVHYCYEAGAKKVYTASLIDKMDARVKEGLQKVDFVGLEIPNQFIIGFGLDYEEYFRNVDGIYIMPKEELF